MEEWQKPENFAIGLGIILLVFTLLSAFFYFTTRIYFKRLIQDQENSAKKEMEYQKEMLHNSIITQEKERERIAADLHDDLISKLNTIHLILSTKAEGRDDETNQMLADSIKLARNISHDLMPPLLDETPLIELLSGFVYPLIGTYQIKIISNNENQKEISSAIKLQVFRVFQEIINNIIKHAEAKHILINIRTGNEYLHIKVTDDGKGFKTEQIKKGLGLNNIKTRIQLLKGTYKYKTEINKGCSVLFSVKI